MVLAFHCALISPVFADYLIGSHVVPRNGFWWWMIRTPFRLAILGDEAVAVFFVLSGLVLTLQVVGPGRVFDWATYYPRRIVRLYLPMVASVILAAIVFVIVPFAPTTSPSIWVQSGTFAHLGWATLFVNFDLFAGVNNINSPTWSLRWEVIFSLLLPVYVLAVRGGRLIAWICIALGPVLVWIAILGGVVSLANLPIFLVGVGIARLYLDHRDRNPDGDSIRAEHPARRHLLWVAIVVLSLALLVAHWLLDPFVAHLHLLQTLLQALPVLGATGIVAAAAFWKPAITLLTRRLFAWLGRVSFSLYLVHVPVLVVTSNLLPRAPWYLIVAIAVPIAFVVAELFMRFVEMPSHRLSRRIRIDSDPGHVGSRPGVERS
jgi:peptidoglycan/LPS O-acetylase OafA/YrhL